jgi:hypothetical protein
MKFPKFKVKKVKEFFLGITKGDEQAADLLKVKDSFNLFRACLKLIQAKG